jgi:MFS family permease
MTSVLVLSFVIPSVVFGVFSGVLVDLWNKRLILIYTNLARAALALCFLFASEEVALIILLAVFFSTASQLFGTADAVTVPAVVPRDQLISANSMFSMAVTGSQLAGMIFIAPIVLPAFGATALFVIAIIMFLVASGCAYLMPPWEGEDSSPNRQLPKWSEFRTAAGEYASTMRGLRGDPVSFLALVQYATGSSLVLLFAVLVPRYMQEVLHVEPDKAVTVFAPVGVGAIVGLRAIPLMVARLGKNRTVIAGMCGLVLSVIALGLVEPIASLLGRTENFNPFADDATRITGLSILVLLTGAFAGPMGVSYAWVNAPAQTVLHERAPADQRGRIFAAQVVLANAIGILPLIVAGSVADILGVTAVLFAIAVALATVAAVSIYLEIKWSTGIRPPPQQGLRQGLA